MTEIIPGTQQTYFVLRYEIKRDRTIPITGRTITTTERVFYKRKGTYTDRPHEAAMLSEEVAEQIKKLYSDKNAIVIKEAGYLTDSDVIHETIESVGEIIPARAFESAVKDALQSLSKTEVKNIFERALA